MPQASRNARKLRRFKRERTLAYKMVDILAKQRDEARAYLNYCAKELELTQARLEKYEPKEQPTDVQEPVGEAGTDPNPVPEVLPTGGVDSLVQEPKEGVVE